MVTREDNQMQKQWTQVRRHGQGQEMDQGVRAGLWNDDTADWKTRKGQKMKEEMKKEKMMC